MLWDSSRSHHGWTTRTRCLSWETMHCVFCSRHMGGMNNPEFVNVCVCNHAIQKSCVSRIILLSNLLYSFLSYHSSRNTCFLLLSSHWLLFPPLILTFSCLLPPLFHIPALCFHVVSTEAACLFSTLRLGMVLHNRPNLINHLHHVVWCGLICGDSNQSRMTYWLEVRYKIVKTAKIR